MTLTSTHVEENPCGEGWVHQKITRRYEADWEEGSAYFKRMGYRNSLTPPATIIPQTFDRDRAVEFFADAVLIVDSAEAWTCNQPRTWTGEVQIPEKDRRNVWHEVIIQHLKIIT